MPTTSPPGKPGRPPKFDRAPTPFGRWLDGSSWTVARLAAKLGISARQVYRMRNGEWTPSLDIAEVVIGMSRGKLGISSFRVDR